MQNALENLVRVDVRNAGPLRIPVENHSAILRIQTTNAPRILHRRYAKRVVENKLNVRQELANSFAAEGAPQTTNYRGETAAVQKLCHPRRRPTALAVLLRAVVPVKLAVHEARVVRLLRQRAGRRPLDGGWSGTD